MEIGYARVSTGEQTLDLQLDALKSTGCGKIYTETASGAKADRPVLDDVLSYLRTGDTLVVWRLDRLGRSLQHLIDVVAALAARGGALLLVVLHQDSSVIVLVRTVCGLWTAAPGSGA